MADVCLWLGPLWLFCFCLLVVYCCSFCLWGFCGRPLFGCALLSVLSSLAIILLRKRELVAILLLSS